jgi:DNA mismatch repair ATPase MutS
MESETIASATERYEKRIAFFSEQAKSFDAGSRRYSNLRLAFASLLYDNASWTFPNVTSSDRIIGQALGHPMIPEQARVDNDARLGPPGRILMVTGSNMSGKTTQLRSIGTNVLLAKAGGPVCAK